MPVIEQINLSDTERAGIIRGLHYQEGPGDEQAKLMLAVYGAIHSVIVDMRRDSSTFLRSFGVDLSRENRRMLYVPPGCAHGYQALRDDSIALYPLSAAHNGTAEKGIRYDDPLVGIQWPLKVTEVSEKDAKWPNLRG